jgi:hypothetical protein
MNLAPFSRLRIEANSCRTMHGRDAKWETLCVVFDLELTVF